MTMARALLSRNYAVDMSHEPLGVRPSSGAADSETREVLEILFPRESLGVAALGDGPTPSPVGGADGSG